MEEATGRRREGKGFYRELSGKKPVTNTGFEMADNKQKREGKKKAQGSSRGSKRSEKGSVSEVLTQEDCPLVVGETNLMEKEKEIDTELEEIEAKDGHSRALHARAAQGEIAFVEDWEIPGDLEKDEVYNKEMTAHKLEGETISRRQVRLQRRKELCDLKQELREQRWRLVQEEKMVEMEETRRQMQQRQQWLVLQKEELDLKEKEAEQAQELENFQKQVRLKGWVNNAVTCTSRGEVASVRSGKTVNSRVLMQADERVGRSNRRDITSLGEEGRRLKEKRNLMSAPETGVTHLRRMGMLPDYGLHGQQLPSQVNTGVTAAHGSRVEHAQENPVKRHHDQWDILSVRDDTGKVNLDDMQGEIREKAGEKEGKKEKVKSGKFAKSHKDLVREEAWPHLSVMRKYAKRGPFDQMDFECFVAGECRVILALQHKDPILATGRLRVLCKVAHWLCKCRDWGAVRNMFEAIIESVELGEEEWTSGFDHYENMLPPAPSVIDRFKKDPKEKEKERERKVGDVFWCKDFQKGTCMETPPHMAQLKPDDKPVMVVHICATCWSKEKKKWDHPETDPGCPHKKA